MTEFESVTESLENALDAIARLGEALVNWVSAAVKTMAEALGADSIVMAAAYAQAKKKHPEWVHRAEYSKKKRIRKKYHDRIMKAYWRME